MGLNFNNLIGKLAVGSSNATKAYLGSQLVWSAGTPASLLLHFDNNFNDSSVNNIPVTVNNVSTSSDQSKFGNYSGYFSGPNDSSKLTLDQEILLGTSDFTIEFWMYLTAYDVGEGAMHIIGRHNSGVGANWLIAVSPSSGLYWEPTGAGTAINTPANSIQYNTWQHIAIVRKCGVVRAFINGDLAGEANCTGDLEAGSLVPFTIGGDNTGTNCITGYLDDVRIVKNLAVYTGPFDPPSAPLSAYANEVPVSKSASLLLHFDGDFTDSSPNVLMVTPHGDAATTTAQSKFGGYSLNPDGGYLEVSGQEPFAVGSDDWTIEAWVKLDFEPTTGQSLVSKSIADVAITTGNNGLSEITFSAGGDIRVALAATADFGAGWLDAHFTTPGGNFSAGSWKHIAVCRNGEKINCFWDGQLIGSEYYGTYSIYPSTDVPLIVGARFINNLSQQDQHFVGYIDELRITKGLAVYTGSYTPPTSPLSAVATQQPINASLVLNFDGNFNDQSVNNAISTVTGDAVINTSVKKFGSGSLELFGTNFSHVIIPNNPEIVIGSSDWTVEAWVWIRQHRYWNGICSKRGVSPDYAESGLGIIGTGGNGELHVTISTQDGSWSFDHDVYTNMPTQQWVHVAVVRKSNLITAYVNGVAGQNFPINGTISDAGRDWTIGGGNYNQQFFDGYIDAFRFTKAALYCSNFCVPTSPPTPTATAQQCLSAPPPPVYGCTDASAYNYNPSADTDDGSCYYCYDDYSNVQFSNCVSCEQANFYIFDSCGNYLRDDTMYSSDCSAPGCTDPNAVNYNSGAFCDDGSCYYALLKSYGGFVNYGANGTYKFWPYNYDQNPNHFTLSCLGITWTVDGWQTRNSYGLFFEYPNNPLDHLDEFAINPNMNLRDDGYGLAPIAYTDGINAWIQAAGASNYVQMLIATEDTGVVHGRTIIKLMGAARTNPNFRMRLAFVENYVGTGDFATPMAYVLQINEPFGDAVPNAGDWTDISLSTAFNILQSSSNEYYDKQWG